MHQKKFFRSCELAVLASVDLRGKRYDENPNSAVEPQEIDGLSVTLSLVHVFDVA